jgi:hypothetical protein
VTVPYNIRSGITVPIVADTAAERSVCMDEQLGPRALFEALESGARLETEASAALVRRYFEMWNTGQGGLADEVLSRQYVDHAHPEVIGPAATRAIARRFHRVNPEARMTPEILAADAEYVAVRNTIRKTHQGEPVEVSGTALFRIVAGRIVEQWSWYPGKGARHANKNASV